MKVNDDAGGAHALVANFRPQGSCQGERGSGARGGKKVATVEENAKTVAISIKSGRRGSNDAGNRLRNVFSRHFSR